MEKILSSASDGPANALDYEKYLAISWNPNEEQGVDILLAT